MPAGLCWAQSLLALLVALLAALLTGQPARAQTSSTALPGFAELEAAGVRIGVIQVRALDIFDTSDPREDKALFRAANRLHIHTQAAVVRRSLLFASGEPVSARLIEETERLLNRQRYLNEVSIRPLLVRDGVVDIEVLTRDTWSLETSASAARDGGTNSTGVYLREHNLLGSGISLGVARTRTVDRSSLSFDISNPQLLGSWIAFKLSHASNSDGQRDAISLVQPFYALDTRWSAGVSAERDDRIDPVYQAGKIVSRYRHQLQAGEAFAGFSPGLQDGWVQRFSAGLNYRDDAYAQLAIAPSTLALPGDEKLAGPFVRYALLEDRVERQYNRNLMGRPEYFQLGLSLKLQLGLARRETPLASATGGQTAYLYAASVSRGFAGEAGQTLTAQAALSGQYNGGQVQRTRLSGQLQAYLPQGRHGLFYAAVSGQWLDRADPADHLLLGGDNGLRGYPLRYQSGTRRVLVTVEERFFTDAYVWRLFRFGGAVFADIGRAWGGNFVNSLNPGWLGDVGVGLRVVTTRSAFSNVLHVDLAYATNTTPDIKKLQLLVKTKTSF